MPTRLCVSIVDPAPAPFSGQLPDYLMPQMIPTAELEYCEQHWGYIILQEISINGFTIGKYNFEILSACSIQFSLHKPGAMLHYMMDGNMQAAATNLVYPFLSKQYGCFYLPAATIIPVHLQKGSYAFTQLHFSLSFLQKLTIGNKSFQWLAANAIEMYPFASQLLSIDRRLNNILAQVDRYLREKVLQAYFLNGRCMHLLMRFITDSNRSLQQQQWFKKKEDQLNNLEAYILDYYANEHAQPLTSQLMAKKLNLSVYQLNKLSRQVHGISPAALITKMRMDKAMALLSLGTSSVSQVCDKVGYLDVSSFSRAFKTYFGHPPSWYLSH